MIDWVFIDIGNVLFNDDPQNFHAYRLVYETIRAERPQYTFEAMLAEREAMARQGLTWILFKIGQRYLPADKGKEVLAEVREFLTGTYDENNRLNAGAVGLLDQLRPHWKLGIVANQSPECRQSLVRRKLLDYFGVVAISDELDLHKPDIRLYQWALEQAGCDPARAVMIGDRRDNDIAPASSLAMRTILVSWPDCRSKGWCPNDPMAQAFLDSCDRVPLFSAVPVGPEPDRTVTSLPAAFDAIRSLNEPS